MNSVIITMSIIIAVGFLVFFLSVLLRRFLPHPSGDIVYSDSGNGTDEILQSAKLPLVGKPDYIVERDGVHIPIEVKTGKTPQTPYKNHIAQLFAYCFLIEETFKKRPPYGIIRYPDREVPLEYHDSAEDGIRVLVQEILQKKTSGNIREDMGSICRKCREGKHTISKARV